MGRIICVGSLNMDIAAYSEALPLPGETVFGSSIAASPGGKGLNQAVAARRLGADVAFVGNLGRDDAGEKIAAFLAAEGVDTSAVARLDGVPSGAAIILVDARSENAIVVIPGSNMAWPPGRLDEMKVASGDIVVAQFEVPDGIIAEAFAKARRAGARTILNAAPARPMPVGLLPLVDILVVNETELAAAVGNPVDGADIAAVAQAASNLSGPGLAVIATLGSQGAVVETAGRVERIAASRWPRSTPCASDCFIGALAAALWRKGSTRRRRLPTRRRASASPARAPRSRCHTCTRCIELLAQAWRLDCRARRAGREI
jgi:ribokinase